MSGYTGSAGTYAEFVVNGSKGNDVYTLAGSDLSGAYSGDGGPAAQAQLHTPMKVALDSKGNQYIADSGNNVIRKVDAKTGLISTFAGVEGGCAYSGDGGPATSAQFCYPTYLVFDAQDNLYISDTDNNVIRKVSSADGSIATVVSSKDVTSGDGGPTSLWAPHGIALDTAGNLYIADTTDQLIRKVSGGVITTIGGCGWSCPTQSTNSNGQSVTLRTSITAPLGLAVDAAGMVYFAEPSYYMAFTGEVGKINTATGMMSNVAGNSSTCYYGSGACTGGDGSQATTVALSMPSDIALDGSGNLYFVEPYYAYVGR